MSSKQLAAIAGSQLRPTTSVLMSSAVNQATLTLTTHKSLLSNSDAKSNTLKSVLEHETT